ncbi:MAG: DoxX family membrane protein [Candidatus Omnitrophica bacterium]|nr:DoxX family membrane protein [Candidatus Omnitrophota bacterium]
MVWLRLLVGTIFTVSGFEKAVGTSANFLYIIQQYQIVPLPLARLASEVFPWVELLTGLFILLGLWLPVTLRVSALISSSLMLLVGQAILRRLPIDNCGCFGELVHLPLGAVFFVDLGMLAAALACLRYLSASGRFGLDRLCSATK